MLGEEEIQNRFGFHKGTEITGPKHNEVRHLYLALALKLDQLLPDGRPKSIALTTLDEACMWSNKAIAETAPLVDE